MSPSTLLRAGLVGLGTMGRNHARVLAGLDGVELVGVADPLGDPQRAAHGVPVLTSVDALIDCGLDYCVVAVPTADHDAVALRLADAGVHMLIEKPVASDQEVARKMIAAFNRAGLVGAVGHIERYNPALQQMKKRLAHGDLGEVFQIATRRQGPFPARIDDVGVVKDLATHDLDLTAWVSGQPFTSLNARTAHKSGRRHEDLVAVTGQLADGTVTNHLVNWLSPLKERMTVVTGGRGSLVADTLTADLTYYANGTIDLDWQDVAHFRGMTEGDVIRYAFPKPEPLRTEHEMFRDAVLGRDAEIVTLEQGLTAVRVAEAVLESAATGQTVQLAEAESD